MLKPVAYGSSLLAIILLLGACTMFRKSINTKIENFDDIWGLGDPVLIENKFHELLPEAESLADKSIYLQILSQIALTQALQKKFDQAHKTLNDAETLLSPEYELARVRILLERGRVFHQSEKIPDARKYFEQAFELSANHAFDYQTINAAHMIAIVAENPEEKILWNQRALDLAIQSKNKLARGWLGSLYNNLGQNYLELAQLEKALSSHQKALEYREKEGYAPNIRVAKWQVAHVLRLLGRPDDALSIQLALLKEYTTITESDSCDMPIEMLKLARGWVYEELAEIYDAKAKKVSSLAYDDLSKDPMFSKTEHKRLARLKQIQQ